MSENIGNEQENNTSLVETSSQGLTAESYELNVPDEMNLSDEERSRFDAVAKELKLDNSGTQKLLEMTQRNQQEQVQKHNQLMDEWKNEILKDKHMGGSAFESTVAYAKAGLARFDPDNNLFNLLEQTGYGSNPHVVRFLAAIGRSHAEDKVLLGSPSKTEAPRHERLYGKYNNL